MNYASYRFASVLLRVSEKLDRFYMGQEIDWQYDVRTLLDQILELAMKEIEFGEGSRIDRALIIAHRGDGQELEVSGGWRVGEEEDRSYSRTIVERTLSDGKPILCENAKEDPRFDSAESLKEIPVLSLVSVPIRSESTELGVVYLERRDSSHFFTKDDLAFVTEFAKTIAPYIKTALVHQQHVAEINALRDAASQESSIPNVLGRSKAMEEVNKLAKLAAGVEKTVLITGESGSGKESLANAIHLQSNRSKKPFIVVDCSSLSENLLESELFGHTAGSFTGATTDKAGAFKDADGGFLFLDEICDAPYPMQQKLRRVLQEGEIRRVGDNKQMKVDVRVICATNRDLASMVDSKEFLHDLYHRIHQFPIRLPSLRERKEDIPLLVNHFIGGSGSKKNPPVTSVTPDALQVFMTKNWDANNVRELKNVVELAVDLSEGEKVDLASVKRTLEIRGEHLPDLPDKASDTAGPRESASIQRVFFQGEYLQLNREESQRLLASTTEDAKKEDRPYYCVQREFSGKLIIEALRFCDWKLRPAARLLGISPVKLRQDFKAYIQLLFVLSPSKDMQQIADRAFMPLDKLQQKVEDLGVCVDNEEST